MGKILAGLLNWSLISLIHVVTSLLFRFTSPKTGRCRGRVISLWFAFIYSALVIILQVIFLILCGILGSRWSIADACVQSWRSPTIIYFLVIEFLVGLVAFIEINWSKLGFVESQDSCWGHLSSVIEHIVCPS